MFRTRIAALTLVLAGSQSMAQGVSSQAFDSFRARNFEVSITNLTPGQSFTPQFLATHLSRERLFTLGEPASWEQHE